VRCAGFLAATVLSPFRLPVLWLSPVLVACRSAADANRAHISVTYGKDAFPVSEIPLPSGTAEDQTSTVRSGTVHFGASEHVNCT
jgi:hypothetical protein